MKHTVGRSHLSSRDFRSNHPCISHTGCLHNPLRMRHNDLLRSPIYMSDWTGSHSYHLGTDNADSPCLCLNENGAFWDLFCVRMYGAAQTVATSLWKGFQNTFWYLFYSFLLGLSYWYTPCQNEMLDCFENNHGWNLFKSHSWGFENYILTKIKNIDQNVSFDTGWVFIMQNRVSSLQNDKYRIKNKEKNNSIPQTILFWFHFWSAKHILKTNYVPCVATP